VPHTFLAIFLTPQSLPKVEISSTLRDACPKAATKFLVVAQLAQRNHPAISASSNEITPSIFFQLVRLL